MSRTSKTSYIMMSLIVAITSALIGCSAQTNQAATSSQQPTAEQQQPAATAQATSTQEVQKREHLTIQAPVGISLSSPIYKMIEDKSLSPFAENVEYKPWKTPDELRARISSGQAEVSAVPTYVGANLYNRGMDVKLINTLIWGILYMIGPDGEAVSWDSLRGQTVHVPFKGDMPDLVFRYLLKKKQSRPDQRCQNRIRQRAAGAGRLARRRQGEVRHLAGAYGDHVCDARQQGRQKTGQSHELASRMGESDRQIAAHPASWYPRLRRTDRQAS
ncbi:hypothetical protein RGW91_16300 [Brevibacillus parabrevis]|nr:hypothetical protein [Brevibacillus parabrevis]MDR5000485.1 hypothetical protein [Brevibacillus parabrevis]